MAILRDESEEEKLGGQAQSATGPGTPASVPSPGAVPGGSQMAPKYTQSNFTSGRMLLNKAQKTNQPDLTGGFIEKANQRSTDIGKAQADYQKNLEEQKGGYQFGDEDINKAVSGDEGQFKRIKSALSGKPDLGNFNQDVGLDIQDVNALNSNSGVIDAFRQRAQKQGNYGYTSGQAGLDAALFGRSAAGAQQSQAALAKRNEVAQQAQAANAAAAQQKQAAQDEISKNVAGARTGLGNRLDQLQINAANAKFEDMKKNGAGRANEASQALYQKATQDAIQRAYGESGGDAGDPETRKMLEKIYTDEVDQHKNDLADLGYNDDSQYLYDANSAGQFNRLNDLLGYGVNRDATDTGVTGSLGQNFEGLMSKAQGLGQNAISGRDAAIKKAQEDAAQRERNRNQRQETRNETQMAIPKTALQRLADYGEERNLDKSVSGRLGKAGAEAHVAAAERAGSSISEKSKATVKSVKKKIKFK